MHTAVQSFDHQDVIKLSSLIFQPLKLKVCFWTPTRT